jgi:glycosyltransferase involved in cell wall biosynthesis
MEIKGIKYTAPVLDGSGYAKAARGYIMALHKLGVPITINPVSFETARPDLGEEGKILESLINKDIDYNINFIHLTPEFYEKHRESDKINCAYTVWENSKLHKSWPVFINNNVDKVITGSKWGAEIFKESGVTIPIGVCSHCMSVEEFENVGPYQINGVSDDTFIFYDIFQFTEKKAPLDAIKTYWATFQNDEDVALVIKTYRSDFSDGEKDAIRRTVRRIKNQMRMDKYPPIYLILDMLSEEQITALHNKGDCLISLNKGEGVGLVPLQAAAHGNPIIITGWGGSLEYAKPDLAYLVDYFLEPCFGMIYSPWHDGTQWWAKADLKHASELMLRVYNNRNEAKEKGLKLQEHIKDNFSYEAIGKKLIKEIEML